MLQESRQFENLPKSKRQSENLPETKLRVIIAPEKEIEKPKLRDLDESANIIDDTDDDDLLLQHGFLFYRSNFKKYSLRSENNLFYNIK